MRSDDRVQFKSPYAGPVGFQLLSLAYKYHFQLTIQSQEDRERQGTAIAKNDVTQFKAPHGCSLETAVFDKYSKY